MSKKMFGAFAVLGAGLMLMSGCNGAQVKLPYDDQIHPDLDNAYISELFYRNDLGTLAPDPCVIQITDPESTEYGYYYLYATTDPTLGFRAYRNKDLTGPWEDVTPEKNYLAFMAEEGHFAYGKGDFWAPEVIYDEMSDQYYMFYSGQVGKDHRMIAVAVADEPYGPFSPVTTDGLDASKPLFDNDDIYARAKALGVQVNPEGIFGCIDAHPYISPDGTKYLYIVHEGTAYKLSSEILVVEMETWTKPIMDTLTRLTKCGYYTVDDSFTDESGSMQPDYEEGNTVNEGPYIYETQQEDGSWRYYLTFSVNGYTDKSYSVIQAVGTSPMGPFRKLTEEEGGILLSTDWEKFDHVSGTGHHSFVQVDDELYMVYHEHVNRLMGGLGERDVAVDRVMITKNNNGDEVLYCNGPTWSLQPRIAKYSGYENLMENASVSVSSGENASALNDGLLSMYTNNTFVKEFETREKTTITIKFEDWREISAIMVYNSKTFAKSFVGVDRIEFDYRNEAGETKTAYIEDLAFDWDFYKMESASEMRPGGSAVAVFNPLTCKEIRITIEIPEERPDNIAIMDEEGYYIKQTVVAISEIVVLGK